MCCWLKDGNISQMCYSNKDQNIWHQQAIKSYLGGSLIRAHYEEESNLKQLLLLHAEDMPQLKSW